MKKVLPVLLTVLLLLGASTAAIFAANKWGDIYSDGKVDIMDSVKLAQYLAGWDISLTANERRAADVFYDGSIDVKDAVKLAQYLAEWNVVLGDGSENPPVPDDNEDTDTEIEADDIMNMLVIYPEFPEEIRRNYDYDVSVTMDDRTEALPVYNHVVESNVARRAGADMYRRFSMFAFDGHPVRVDIRVKRDFTSYTVFPSAKNFRSDFNDGVISVYLDKPDYFGIQLDDDQNTIISIFADYPESAEELPDMDDPQLLYIDGWYETESGILNITTPYTTVYIAPGAVLNARVKISANYCRVIGRGAIVDPFENIYEYDIQVGGTEGAGYKLLTIGGKGGLLDGPVLLDARCFNITYGGSDHTIRNMKALSAMMTTDGITASGSNSVIEHCWFYVGDNGIVLSPANNCVFRDIAVGTTCSAIFPQSSPKNVLLEDIYVFRSDDGIITNVYNGGTSKPPEDRADLGLDITIRRLSAVELPALDSKWSSSGSMHIFRGANTGTLEKTLRLEDVSVSGVLMSRMIHFRNSTSDKYTDGYTVNIKNLYINGTKIEDVSEVSVEGTTTNNSVALTNDSFYIPVTRNEKVVNYTAPNKVYVGSRQIIFNTLPTRVGGALMMPTKEICAALRGTCDITSEFVSVDELFMAGLISGAQERNGVLYLTPSYNGENLLLPDSGEISYFAEATCYDLDLVVTEDSDGYIYNVLNIDTVGAGISRQVLDEVRMYGTGKYKFTFKAKASEAGKLRVHLQREGATLTNSLDVGTEWVEYSFVFNVDDAMLAASRCVLIINGNTTVLGSFAVRDMSFVKVS
ncbi:MAG: dockerin type I domain-containing protein [Eubacteriales bacterium]